LDVPALLGLVKAIITTKGEAGGVLLEQGRQRAFPSVPANEVKDPTGAGDAFRSGLLKGLSLGLDLLESCLWGATIASYAVACYGTQEYALDQNEFQARLAKARATWPRD
jgi:adenosine kinase